MTDIPLLSLTIFLPLIGALVILLIKEEESSVINIKKVALWTCSLQIKTKTSP